MQEKSGVGKDEIAQSLQVRERQHFTARFFVFY